MADPNCSQPERQQLLPHAIPLSYVPLPPGTEVQTTAIYAAPEPSPQGSNSMNDGTRIPVDTDPRLPRPVAYLHTPADSTDKYFGRTIPLVAGPPPPNFNPSSLEQPQSASPVTPSEPVHRYVRPGLTNFQARLYQQRRFMNNVREKDLKDILHHLRDAVDSLTEAQQKTNGNVRIHLFVGHDRQTGERSDDVHFQQSSLVSLYTLFSPTFIADTKFKTSLVRDMADIFAKFHVLQTRNLQSQHCNPPPSTAPLRETDFRVSASHPATTPTSNISSKDTPQPEHPNAPHLSSVPPHTLDDTVCHVSHGSRPSNDADNIACTAQKVPFPDPPLAQDTSQLQHVQQPTTPLGSPNDRGSSGNPEELPHYAPEIQQDQNAPIHSTVNSNNNDHIAGEDITADQTVPPLRSPRTTADNLQFDQGNCNISALPDVDQVLPPTISMVLPSWFPFTKENPQCAPVKSDINNYFDGHNNPENSNGADDGDNSSHNSHFSTETAKQIKELMTKKRTLLTVNTTEFNNLHLTHIKFIYRTLFKSAISKYSRQKKNSGSSQRFPSSFSYSYFTPPWFPSTIQCIHNNYNIDFQDKVLPDLQSLRHGSITANFCLLLASFKLYETEFASQAIDFMVTKYREFAPDSPFFTPPQRSRKRKRLLPRTDNGNKSPSASNRSRQQTGKRRRSKSDSHTTSLQPDVGSSSTSRLVTSNSRVKFFPIAPITPKFPPAE